MNSPVPRPGSDYHTRSCPTLPAGRTTLAGNAPRSPLEWSADAIVRDLAKEQA